AAVASAPAPVSATAAKPAEDTPAEGKPQELGAASDAKSDEEKPQELGTAGEQKEAQASKKTEGPEDTTTLRDTTAAATTGEVPAQFYPWFWGLAAGSTLV